MHLIELNFQMGLWIFIYMFSIYNELSAQYLLLKEIETKSLVHYLHQQNQLMLT